MARSYLIVLVCQAVAAVATVLSLRWLATNVDPATFGRYTLYQSVVAAGALFLVSWPNAALLRFGREEWLRDGRLGATLGARAVLFLGSGAVAIAIAWRLDAPLRAFLQVEQSPFVWVVMGVLVLPASEMAVYVNQAIGRIEVYGYSPAITRVGFSAGVALIPWLALRPEWTYLAGWLIVSTAAAGAFSLGTMPAKAWSRISVRWLMVTRLLKYSWTLPFAAVSTYVVNWIDSWVIRDVLGVEAVGVYNWAYQVTAIASLAFAPIAVLLTPGVIEARLKNDHEKLNRYADAILPAAIIAALATSLGLIMAFPALQLIVAPSYAPAYGIIAILLSALPFQLIAYLVTPLAHAYERLLPRIVLVSVAIAALNVAGDLLLVTRLGVEGAAIATTASLMAGTLLLIVVIRREGIRFASSWYYAMPALIVLPAVAALRWAGPQRGALYVATGILAVLLVLLHRQYRSGGRPLRETPLATLVNLAKALTLSERVTPP